MAEKLTVLIPCKNERLNIRQCIESVRGLADEILVADSGSEDGTLSIARELGCRIIEREWVHCGDFKNWALPQAEHPWVLVVDADERVTPELENEIRQVLARPKYDGYRIFRNNHFLGHLIRFSQWGSDDVLRLFRKDVSRYVGDNDHCTVEVRGRVGRLRQRLTHYSYWTYDQYFHKFQRYTTFQAEVWHGQGRTPAFWRMLFSLPFRFFYNYVIRLGFLDGMAGVQVCTLIAFYSFAKQARLWELHHALPQPDPEAGRPNETESTPSRMRRVACRVKRTRRLKMVHREEQKRCRIH